VSYCLLRSDRRTRLRFESPGWSRRNFNRSDQFFGLNTRIIDGLAIEDQLKLSGTKHVLVKISEIAKDPEES
jgi:hypothetical protein